MPPIDPKIKGCVMGAPALSAEEIFNASIPSAKKISQIAPNALGVVVLCYDGTLYQGALQGEGEEQLWAWTLIPGIPLDETK